MKKKKTSRRKIPAGSIPVRVSPETTFITEPLYPDGNGVDFARAMEERFTAKIPLSDNGFVDLLRAFGKAVFSISSLPGFEYPESFTADEWKSYAQKLGLDPTAEPALAFEPFAVPGGKHSEEKAEQFGELRSRKWTGREYPEAENWLLKNSPLFEVFETAIRKPHFYSLYTPFYGSNEEFFLGAWFFPGIGLSRTIAQCMGFRSNYRLGNDDIAGAWDDIALIYRLARGIGSQPLMISSLVGMAIEGLANARALAFVGNEAVEVSRIRAGIETLEDIPPEVPFEKILDEERLYGLYELSYFSKHGFGENDSLFFNDYPSDANEIERLMCTIPLDWNIVLKLFNLSIDRISGRDFTDPATGEFHPFPELSEMPKLTDPEWFCMDIGERSDLLGKMYIRHTVSPWGTYRRVLMKNETTLELVRLAFFLEIYRRENGSYPERIEALCESGLIESLPPDRMAIEPGLPYIYRKENAGFLLYSRGISGRDDGGRSGLRDDGFADEIFCDDICIQALCDPETGDVKIGIK